MGDQRGRWWRPLVSLRLLLTYFSLKIHLLSLWSSLLIVIFWRSRYRRVVTVYYNNATIAGVVLCTVEAAVIVMSRCDKLPDMKPAQWLWL